jgi:hypothetical protein
VRRVHNDITFSYAFQEQAGQYVIESREFEKIKQRLLFD